MPDRLKLLQEIFFLVPDKDGIAGSVRTRDGWHSFRGTLSEVLADFVDMKGVRIDGSG